MQTCASGGLRGYELSAATVQAYSHAVLPDTRLAFVTFTNRGGLPMALNWMRQLQLLQLHGLIGITEAIGSEGEESLRAAGGAIFCADSPLARAQSAAGRWKHVAPVLSHGVDVLVSDADIGWVADPRPYLRKATKAHPTLDLLLVSDRVANAYSSAPFTTGAASTDSPELASSEGGVDLQLEDAYVAATPSLNIGIVYCRARKADVLIEMFEAWAASTVETETPHKATQKREPSSRCIW